MKTARVNPPNKASKRISWMLLLLFVAIAGFTSESIATDLPIVKLETSVGEITVQLYRDKAPATVENFLRYVNEGFYNGTVFHRVIPNFMIQGGGLTADMQSKQTRPSIKNEADNGLKNNRGTIAMARTTIPDSANSQFFINLANNDFLNFKDKSKQGWGYCVFGKVLSGMDVVDKIAAVKTTSKLGHQDVPVETITIKQITMVQAASSTQSSDNGVRPFDIFKLTPGTDDTQSTKSDDLIEVVREADIGRVRVLLERGADLNQKDSKGDSLLNIALIEGHVEIAKLLIEKGAAPNRESLEIAAFSSQTEIVELLLEKGMNPARTGALVAAASGALYSKMMASLSTDKDLITIVDFLKSLEDKYDIDIVIDNDDADVHKVIRILVKNRGRDHAAVIKLLLEVGADPNRDEGAALHVAAIGGPIEIVELLLAAGADPNQSKKLTPLHVAALTGQLEIAERLIKAGANPHQAGKEGITPLFLAVAGSLFPTMGEYTVKLSRFVLSKKEWAAETAIKSWVVLVDEKWATKVDAGRIAEIANKALATEGEVKGLLMVEISGLMMAEKEIKLRATKRDIEELAITIEAIKELAPIIEIGINNFEILVNF